MSTEFRNWAGNQVCHPSVLQRPMSEDEVCRIVRSVREAGGRLRAVGSGHSWSDIACTDETMLSLDGLNRLVAIDWKKNRVTVEAGMRIADLSSLLATHGLALSNLGSIGEQTVAGAFSTGTHGTGIGFGNLATQAVRLQLVTGTGEIVEWSETSDRERFLAARVGLGCFGILTEITIQCEPAFNLEEHAEPVPFETALRDMPETVARNEHVKYWWFPHTETVQVYKYNRTDRPASRLSRMKNWFDDSFLPRTLFTTLLRLGALAPNMIPKLNAFARTIHFRERKRIDRSDRVFNIPVPPIHNETEYAIPAEQAPEALERLRDAIEENGWLVNFVVEARFVAGDESPLSPDYHRDSCHIGAYHFGERGRRAYFEGFERLMRDYDGRPHWGKSHTLTGAELRALYPEWETFNRYRKEADPDGIFVNDFIERLLS